MLDAIINEADISFSDNHADEHGKEAFYKYLQENGIDFNDVDSETHLPIYLMKVIRNDPVEYNRFNNVIYQLNKEEKITITDAMNYLVDDWIDPPMLLKCLDEMNYYMLINALKIKYPFAKFSTKDSGMDEFFL